MKSLEIFDCDFSNKSHTEGLIFLLDHYKKGAMGDGEPLSEDTKTEVVEGLKKHPSLLILLVKYEGEFAGLSNCFVNFATFSATPFINIHDIVILEKFRGKGLGRQLMNAIAERAKKIGCKKITLEVRADNTNAQHLYKSLGYTECEPVMHFWTKYL